MSEPAIEAVGLSKKFRIRSEVRHSFKERFTRGRAPAHRDFWALRDATFSVPRGSSLAIIGHNGSGKSTALKVLTGIYRPTSGSVSVNGRVAALLEVGAGFHPELTGRENIRLNGTILGFTGREMDRMMDEIIDFADIGDFIDNPIKHYSSGMHVRLGFAVSVMVRPEILIVDEVIAVGDEEFQRKCFDHMHGLRRDGTTMVLVSHSMAQVQQLCDEAVWLEHGVVQDIGPTRSVATAYLDRVNQTEADRAAANSREEVAHDRRGSGEIRVAGVSFLGADRAPLQRPITGSATIIRLDVRVERPVERVSFGIEIRNTDGVPVMALESGADDLVSLVPGAATVDWDMGQFLLAPGQYQLRTFVKVDGHSLDVDDVGDDFVIREGGAHQSGAYVQPGDWRIEQVSTDPLPQSGVPSNHAAGA